ncbi:MAG: hypothetical protein IJD59_05445, partial [Clostridia bacterium]|nr:hypothetical protein [Clostridia bacterium]
IEDFRNGFVFDGNKNPLPPSAHYAKHNVGGVNRMVDGGRENPLNKNLPNRIARKPNAAKHDGIRKKIIFSFSWLCQRTSKPIGTA